MFKESEVLVAVLQHLASLNVPALGLHDGLMVAGPCMDIAQKVMEQVARDTVGITVPISVKVHLEAE
jgi:hypothetical protein